MNKLCILTNKSSWMLEIYTYTEKANGINISHWLDLRFFCSLLQRMYILNNEYQDLFLYFHAIWLPAFRMITKLAKKLPKKA